MLNAKQMAENYMGCCQNGYDRRIGDLFASESRLFDAGSGLRYGPSGLAGNVELLHRAFPKIQFELLQYAISQDESLMVRWRLVPDSIEIKVQERLHLSERNYTGVDLLQFKGQKINAVQMYLDTPGDLLDYHAMRTCHEKEQGYNDRPAKELPPQMISSVCSSLEGLLNEDKLYLNPNLRLPQVARLLGLSQNQLSAIINRTYQQGFNDYINRLRIDEAKALFRNKQHTLLDIALQSGFNSQSMFNTTFKKITGMTPGRYRKAHCHV